MEDSPRCTIDFKHLPYEAMLCEQYHKYILFMKWMNMEVVIIKSDLNRLLRTVFCNWRTIFFWKDGVYFVSFEWIFASMLLLSTMTS